MKIIHCADIHLDSKINANLSAAKTKQRKAEVLSTFCDMIKFAKEEKVDAVIIAGDLFDSNRCSDATKQVVLSEISGAKDVDFLYLCGNHDAGKTLATAEIPSNLKLFSDSWGTFYYGEVAITGAELNSNNCRGIYDSLVVDPEKFNIVVLHGAKAYTSGEDIVNLGSLADKGIDYLALGHYHSFECGKLDNRGEWCYSGCLEGRGFDECGDKGFVLLEIEGKTYNKRFVKAAKRNIESVICDISGLFDMGEIHNKVINTVDPIDRDSMVRLSLSGDIPEESNKDITFLNEKLNAMFYFAKVVDDTRVKINPEDYANDVSLKGEFIRRVMAADLSEETRSRVIECGLSALKGREVF